MKTAILKTLHYADIFDYPLTFEELRRYLVEKHTNKIELETNMNELISNNMLAFKDGYYFLPGRGSLIGLREERKKWVDIKLKRVKKIAKFLKIIPWMKMVAVTGALAVENCKEGDDIDLMIITSKSRLWLSRGLTVLFLRLFGLYRRPQKIKDTICPNVWISTRSLKFSDEDLFTAHEIAQIKPLREKDNCYQNFIKNNLWIKKFLPNWEPSYKTSGRKELEVTFTLGIPVFDFLDLIFYKLQLTYMRSKMTRETVGRNLALFHPSDKKDGILSDFNRRIADLSIP